ncbi:ABC transporter permease [Algicella marina]|uniref:FtsX-like permease family protein n=1 Tax=Algicella marina TaxID=2683284 RepID=A0A6P1T2A0_9RHOB|nr:ABC transporter permease [Algicella marina]QHQ35783.1 FtsX-like permease family protein [Algicella marina]
MTRWVLAALLGHWKRRPWQALALLLGLATATALWSGVQALNAEARASYARASALLGADRFASIAVAGGAALPQVDYVALRRAGWRVSPVLEGEFSFDGRDYRLIGIDPLTLPPGTLGTDDLEEGADLVAFLAPPYRIFGGPTTVAALSGADLPSLRSVESLPEGTLVGDIGFVQGVLRREGEISRLIVMPEQKPSRLPLSEITATRLVETLPRDVPELASLTESFHMNLTAFGLLSFVVGHFIVHATIGLAFEQRRPLFRTLRALGVSRGRLLAALVVELGALALVAGFAGTAMGYVIAATLLPDVAASLQGLYGAQVAGSLSLSPLWWLAGMAISLGGAGVAAASSLWKAAHLPILAPAGAEAWHGAEKRQQRVQRGMAAVLALVALAAGLGGSLLAGFVLMGAVLMTAALLLPSLLSLVIAWFGKMAVSAEAQWFWADTRAQLGGLSLALMALLLALSVNIGVGTMVDGFRQTFLGYLDKRLASELYVYAESDEQGEALVAALEAEPEVEAILPIRNVETRYEGFPVFVYGFRDHETYRDNWPMLAAVARPWARVAEGDAVLISEQMARRFSLVPGATLVLPTPRDDWALEVAGVYPDYGNPTGQMMVAMPALLARWQDVEYRRFGVRVTATEVPALKAALVEKFALSEAQLVDQAALKAVSRRIFETTFAVTVALNALTLAVAGLALFTSLLTLATLRLPHLAPVWALGMTRRRLAGLEMVRSLALALFTAVLAIPLGLTVAWVLTHVINVKAFGWMLPVYPFPGQWARLMALALAVAALASFIPAARLARMSPADLLRLFSHER